MVAEIVLPAKSQGHLRRLDMRRDLAKVADLVELCFLSTLDPEGRQYLKDMRRAAQNASWLMWTSRMVDEAPMPPSGFIWEEDGQLVGNLSLIPISLHGKRGYMIANVATHPNYRGRGIGRALTSAALDYARSRNAADVWLQVRDDNPSAIHIYETSGFVERLRRTSWYSGPIYQAQQATAKGPGEAMRQGVENEPRDRTYSEGAGEPSEQADSEITQGASASGGAGEAGLPPGIKVLKRRREHWELQHQWLKRLYPPEMEWNVPMDWNIFRMDLWGQIYRLFSLDYPTHWSVERDNRLQGVFTWRYLRGYTSPVWLAIPPDYDDEAVLALLYEVRQQVRVGQPLSLNFPAGLAADVLGKAGFYAHQTLIWMEYQDPLPLLTKL